MPGIESSSYRSFAFAAIVSAVLGLTVSAVAGFLGPRIAGNREAERKEQVLVTTRVLELDARPKRERIESLYADHIVEKELATTEGALPFFLAMDGAGRTTAICLPLAGPGLWGPIRGYLALDASARRVLRITFYEHRETPGLGAEISAARWTRQWSGKSILDEAERLTPIVVKKGKVDPLDSWEEAHAVDGISGATISGNAVARIAGDALRNYQSYLEEQWHKN